MRVARRLPDGSRFDIVNEKVYMGGRPLGRINVIVRGIDSRSSNLPTCASISNKRAFIRTLYERIAQDEVVPPSGDWPWPVYMLAHRTTALLIGTGVSVAKELFLALERPPAELSP